jgi:hypothetical protein
LCGFKKKSEKKQNRFCGIENPPTFAPPIENGAVKKVEKIAR